RRRQDEAGAGGRLRLPGRGPGPARCESAGRLGRPGDGAAQGDPGAEAPGGRGLALPGLRSRLLVPAEAHLLAGASHEIPDDTPQDGARGHDPDETRVPVEEHVVDARARGVLDDEDDEDDGDEERNEELRHPSLPGTTDASLAILEGLATRRWRRLVLVARSVHG